MHKKTQVTLIMPFPLSRYKFWIFLNFNRLIYLNPTLTYFQTVKIAARNVQSSGIQCQPSKRKRKTGLFFVFVFVFCFCLLSTLFIFLFWLIPFYSKKRRQKKKAKRKNSSKRRKKKRKRKKKKRKKNF